MIRTGTSTANMISAHPAFVVHSHESELGDVATSAG